jgi:hypothetical protein
MYESAVRICGQLSKLVAGLDPDAVSGPTARELWAEFDRIERLGSAGKTLLARRIAAIHDGDRADTRTAAEALARQAGTSTAAAKEALDTSHRLTDLGAVDAAVRRGELSPAQAAAISSAAEADRSTEWRLLELAGRASLTELREECARVKAAADPDPDATNRRIHAQRRCRQYSDAEGGWNLSARGTRPRRRRLHHRAQRHHRRSVHRRPPPRQTRTRRGLRLRRPHDHGHPRRRPRPASRRSQRQPRFGR